MKKSITYGAEVDSKNKEFTIHQKEQFYHELFGTFVGDKPVDVIIKVETREKSRSLQQLRYYRGVMLLHAQKAWFKAGCNYSLDYIDKLMKAEFLYSEIVNGKTGKVNRFSWSMSDAGGVSTVDFNEKKEEIQRWYAENLDYSIPDPNEEIKTS